MHFIPSVPVFYANGNQPSVGLTRVQIKESLSIENLTVKLLEGRGEERERGEEEERGERVALSQNLFLFCI